MVVGVGVGVAVAVVVVVGVGVAVVAVVAVAVVAVVVAAVGVGVAVAVGYERIGTYTLGSEEGASLRGAGWRLLGERGGGTWSRSGRERTDKAPTEVKQLWEVTA